MRTGPRTLVVRLDSVGDVLLAGPAVRAVAAGSSWTAMLCGPRGAAAARLLPGVDEVLEYDAPWVGLDAPPVSPAVCDRLVRTLAARRFDRALVLVSYHQSPLPIALLLRLAGVAWIGADSEDYPGTLLDLRHRRDPGRHEVEAALDLARAAGFTLPPGDDGGLRVTSVPSDAAPLPDRPPDAPVPYGATSIPAVPPGGSTDALSTAGRPAAPPAPCEEAPHPSDARGAMDLTRLTGPGPYVVLHPGAAVPARAWSPARAARAVAALHAAGYRVVVTGSAAEQGMTALVAGRYGIDLGGATTGLGELSSVLARAGAVVTGNTGPAHLAAAVRTPVVCLFAPVVPAERWRPYGVPHVLLGDQRAPCALTRARACPVPGHPCLDAVGDDEVVAAVTALLRRRPAAAPEPTPAPPPTPTSTPTSTSTSTSISTPAPARGGTSS
ncbi:glycosyltransferase family 9 protein [Streptomyces sp. NPDC053431]|uniref:glycosyltransferase family 9 protein n=1 Tax=Streptomyces sp. NPDC053431 TaxID=3365703 RepID=UPI0037D600C1